MLFHRNVIKKLVLTKHFYSRVPERFFGREEPSGHTIKTLDKVKNYSVIQ